MIPPLGADTTGIHTMKYSEIFLWLNTDVLAEGESHGWLIRRGDDEGGYRLSFTVGGLLSPQDRALAEMYLNRMGGGSTERSSQTKISEKVNEKSDKSAGEEVGESIAAIRQQAIEENVLAIRMDSANRRVVAGTTRRLSALTVGELAYLAGSDSCTSDREALMWIAMCRDYAIVREFAGEVLKKHYLVGNLHLDFEDYA